MIANINNERDIRFVTLLLLQCAFSTCSQKVRLCLAEKALAFEAREVNLASQEHLTPAYLALNPNGVVPTLVVDGTPIIESSVICEYLDELAPPPSLTPPDALGRARMRAWMRYLEEVPTAAIRIPSFNRIFAGAHEDISDAEFNELIAPMPLRRQFYREMGRAGFSQHRVSQSLDRLRQTLERAERAVTEGWLVGEQFTLADILLIPTVVRMEDLGLAHLWSDLPAFADWFERVQKRPSFSATFYAGSRLDERFEWVATPDARLPNPMKMEVA